MQIIVGEYVLNKYFLRQIITD